MSALTLDPRRALLSCAMQEFTSVSASSYDPAALATKLTEKSAEGWSVVSIVPTGGDVTAFLSRDSSGGAEPAVAEPAAAEPVVAAAAAVAEVAPAAAATSTFAPTLSASAPAAITPEPTPTPAVAEPAGWAMSPEPASTAPTTSMAPISEATTAYQAQPAASYQPQAAAQPAQSYQPAAATPAVPAGWYADPAGRFELRYWDGGTWTEHVSRAGQQFTDPPVA
jgi:hypothetical protein